MAHLFWMLTWMQVLLRRRKSLPPPSRDPMQILARILVWIRPRIAHQPMIARCQKRSRPTATGRHPRAPTCRPRVGRFPPPPPRLCAGRASPRTWWDQLPGCLLLCPTWLGPRSTWRPRGRQIWTLALSGLAWRGLQVLVARAPILIRRPALDPRWRRLLAHLHALPLDLLRL